MSLFWSFREMSFYDENASLYVRFLYKLLVERPEHVKVSKKIAPTFEKHVDFVYSEPYKKWYIVVNADQPDAPMGHVYVTKNNEIGIFLDKPFEGKGYGKEVLEEFLLTLNTGEEYTANINPTNEKSRKLFEKFGFKMHHMIVDHDNIPSCVVYKCVL